MMAITLHTFDAVYGGYDNESIAVTAMVTTFYFKCGEFARDNPANSHQIGIVTGFGLPFGMVAARGG
jgi:hypothetical protein